MDNNKMNTTILKSKNIKSEAFREYSHLQGYVTSKKFFQETLYYNQSKKGVKTYYTTKLRRA